MIADAPVLILRTLLAASALCSTSQAMADSAGFANERRVVINRLVDNADARQFNSIGQVQPGVMNGPTFRSSVHGTGFLVSPCLVLTNFHVAYGHGDSLMFYFGQTGDPQRPFRYFEKATPIAAGNFVTSITWSRKENPERFKWYERSTGTGTGEADVSKRNASKKHLRLDLFSYFAQSEDWALLKLEHSAPQGFDTIPVMPLARDALSGITLATAGFPADLAATEHFVNLYGDMHCSAFETSSNPDVIISDCMANFGDSGSPIMARASNGRLAAVGIVSTGRETSEFRRMSDRFFGTGFDDIALRYPDLLPTEYDLAVRKTFGAAPPAHAASDATLQRNAGGVQDWSMEVGLFTAPLPEDYFASALDAHADKAKIARRAAYISVGQRIRQLIDTNRCTP